MRRTLLIIALCLSSTPVFANVAEPVDPNDFIDTPVAGFLIASNVVLAVANTVQVVGDGSYLLGALGIGSGLTALIVAAAYDDLERSRAVDVSSVLSMAAGAFSIGRRAYTPKPTSVSFAPLLSRSWWGVSVSVRF
jgi:hypothetical protein